MSLTYGVGWRQLRPPRLGLLLGWTLPLLVLLGVWLLSLGVGAPVEDLTRDTNAVLKVPPYVGVLSNVGVLLWAAAAALALFAAALLWLAGRRDRVTAFLTLLGLLTGLLVIDDLFMVHEWVFPMVLSFPPWLLLVGEAVGLVVLLAAGWPVLANANLFFLGSALGGFSGSVALDFLPHDLLPGHYLLEDGFKFVGIVNWLAFTVQLCARHLVARVASR